MEAEHSQVGAIVAKEGGFGLFEATSDSGSVALRVFFLGFLPNMSLRDMSSVAPKASFMSTTFDLLPIPSKLLKAYTKENDKI
jgi:hypothetical protein